MKKCNLLVERLPNELRLTHLSFWLFSSIITEEDLRHSGHRSQLCHTDWLWWRQVPKTTSAELVCSNSQVSIMIPCGAGASFIVLSRVINHLTNVIVFALLTLFLFCLFRNRTGGKRTSFSWKQRVFMLLLVGVLGFFTLIIIMAKLGRASAGSDPNLDPLLNPHIRVGKNWWRALIPSPPPVLHNVRLCRWSWNGTVHRRVSPAEGAVYPTWME